MSEKEEKLEELRKDILSHGILSSLSPRLVFGEGNICADVLFIGEAPGQKEDELLRPFVGRAGTLLNKNIEAVGWKREDVYITNIVKQRPPENRDPLPEEIESYRPYLSRHIEILQPKIIAPLGRFSMNYFLPQAKISRDQGKLFFSQGKFIFPIYHPAAALRATAVMSDFEKSFRVLATLVKQYDKLLEKAHSQGIL
jgi:DNA polymerase